MQCRSGCAACCIAPSISSPIPGLPEGKKAGEPCPHLDIERRCKLFASAERPSVCGQFQAEPAVCGDDAASAFALLASLEERTVVF